MTRAAQITPAHLGLEASAPQSLSRAAGVVRRWAERRRSRLALARLDLDLVRDIGLDPAAAQAEAARPFWR